LTVDAREMDHAEKLEHAEPADCEPYLIEMSETKIWETCF